ncbi:MAG: hypothetical protein M1832_003038 [Thelocarpon impressellum]|nr:MAG: hypothetical protein M1832_003038 [Thelocarpon impressellum]
MKIRSAIALLLAGAPLINALSLPNLQSSIVRREAEALAALVPAEIAARSDEALVGDLEKRRGGGGGGGGGSGGGGGGGSGGGSGSGGGGSGGGSSGGGSSGGGSSSGGSSSGSSGGGSSGSGSSGASSGSRGGSGGSNAGGSTTQGSGAPRFYGGYYGGGSATPYTAGKRSPRGITPRLLPIAALSIFPGLWLYSAFSYPYNRPYYFRNSTDGNRTAPLPVTCLCQEYSVCGCDDNDDSTFLTSVLPNGTDTSRLNKSVVAISQVDGRKTIVLNGTLPNGTTAPGGTDPVSAGVRQLLLEHAGWWVVGGIVYAAVWML